MQHLYAQRAALNVSGLANRADGRTRPHLISNLHIDPIQMKEAVFTLIGIFNDHILPIFRMLCRIGQSAGFSNGSINRRIYLNPQRGPQQQRLGGSGFDLCTVYRGNYLYRYGGLAINVRCWILEIAVFNQ